MIDVSIDQHALDLQQMAYKHRSQFRADVEVCLAECVDEDEQIDVLSRFACINQERLNTTAGSFGYFQWWDHETKTFLEFAEWHIDNGGWKRDFQEKDFKGFACCWASNWILNWTCQQIHDIYSRRIEEKERMSVDEPMYIVEKGVSANKSAKFRKPHASTIARYARLNETVDNFMKIEGHQRTEAMKLAAEKHGCSLDTVERALRVR